MWLLDIMRGHDSRFLNMFRMDKHTFINLCQDLENYYGLVASPRMSILEKLGIFVCIIYLEASNRQVQERFQRSGDTISRVFREDPTFSTVPPEILDDERYMPHLQDCIGAINGTHVSSCVEEYEIIRFIGRKGMPTENIMAVCSFDMQFTFVLPGWEGTTHDGRIFQCAIHKKELNFPKPPPGFLAPYKGTRYHLPEFQRGGRLKRLKETFNRWHSSLRCCIERTFRVWKARWKIL
ncbi:uncharacterized protein LOC126654973 [Mercurialis annua]|uniref:uncharacterized protein LOC126654973 n=1 Tax=Mercurialis annua TaxID=3986 RepID=UPI0024AD5609|nr:uncharacterized protein LOC126654973 [Mercurialis annua]